MRKCASRSRSARLRRARRRSSGRTRSASKTPSRRLEATRSHWAKRLGVVKIETNRPDFDRLVNIWLPYQLYASRLFGRIGPNQRGGAWGFRDQLQDVLPLTHSRAASHAGANRAACGSAVPRGRRAQVVARGARRRHGARPAHQGERPAPVAALRAGALRPRDRRPQRARRRRPLPGGPRCPGARRHAGRRAARFARKRRRLSSTPSWRSSTRSSTWARTACRCYAPATGTTASTGSAARRSGRAYGWASSSTTCSTALWRWPASRATRALAGAARPRSQRLGAALEVGWFGDHYGLDFADNGQAIAAPNAMTTGWAAHSGAVAL